MLSVLHAKKGLLTCKERSFHNLYLQLGKSLPNLCSVKLYLLILSWCNAVNGGRGNNRHRHKTLARCSPTADSVTIHPPVQTVVRLHPSLPLSLFLHCLCCSPLFINTFKLITRSRCFGGEQGLENTRELNRRLVLLSYIQES